MSNPYGRQATADCRDRLPSLWNMPPSFDGGGSAISGRCHLFVTVQLPFVDFRRFQTGHSVLDSPFWPIPRSGDFVRSAGSTAPRPLGGIGGWIGEPMFCDASRALRYSSHPSYILDKREREHTHPDDDPKHRFFHVPFRRLYFDGLAVGKFEIGFSTGTPLDFRTILEFDEVPYVLQQLLSTKVRIPSDPPGELREVPLYRAGARLAQFYDSSSRQHFSATGSSIAGVQAGEAVLFVQLGFMRLDRQSDWTPLAVPPGQEYSWGLYHNAGIRRQVVRLDGVAHRVWMLDDCGCTGGYSDPEHSYSLAKDHLRALRIAILRLHAEKQAFRAIQREILTGRLQVVPRSPELDRLQLYLGRAVSRIRGKESRVADLVDRERTIEWVRAFEDQLTAGESDELLNNVDLLELRLENFQFRPSILKTILRYQKEVTLVMGDQYINHGQAGSMGPESMGFVEIAQRNQLIFDLWKEIEERNEWPAIQEAIRQLTPELQRKAQDDEQIQAVKNLLKATEAAEQQDGQRLVYYLKRAGAWVADVAKEVGAEVMTQLILRVGKIG